jgi:hypothetical protein
MGMFVFNSFLGSNRMANFSGSAIWARGGVLEVHMARVQFHTM